MKYWDIYIIHTDAYCNQCVNFFTLFSPNLHTDHQCVNRPVLGTGFLSNQPSHTKFLPDIWNKSPKYTAVDSLDHFSSHPFIDMRPLIWYPYNISILDILPKWMQFCWNCLCFELFKAEKLKKVKIPMRRSLVDCPRDVRHSNYRSESLKEMCLKANRASRIVKWRKSAWKFDLREKSPPS